MTFHLISATWCGPCNKIKPLIAQIVTENNLTLESHDIDEEPELTEKYNLTGVPTLLYLKNGKVVDSYAGSLPHEIKNFFENNIKNRQFPFSNDARVR